MSSSNTYTHVSNRSMEEAMENNPLSTQSGVDEE